MNRENAARALAAARQQLDQFAAALEAAPHPLDPATESTAAKEVGAPPARDNSNALIVLQLQKSNAYAERTARALEHFEQRAAYVATRLAALEKSAETIQQRAAALVFTITENCHKLTEAVRDVAAATTPKTPPPSQAATLWKERKPKRKPPTPPAPKKPRKPKKKPAKKRAAKRSR